MSRSKLASRIIDGLNKLSVEENANIRRVYEKTFWVAYLAVAGLVTPTGDARPRLEDLERVVDKAVADTIVYAALTKQHG